MIRLREFDARRFDRGRPRTVEAAWLLCQWLFVSCWVPGAAHRRLILRLFGAKIGKRVNLKPFVRIKFPWRLEIGDDSWIGEDAWIDNLDRVTIGANCCISQGAYLCTGSHDWSKPAFDLTTRPIEVMDFAWVAASSVVGPGVRVGTGAVLGLGSVASDDLEPWHIYRGNPAVKVRWRQIETPLGGEALLK